MSYRDALRDPKLKEEYSKIKVNMIGKGQEYSSRVSPEEAALHNENTFKNDYTPEERLWNEERLKRNAEREIMIEEERIRRNAEEIKQLHKAEIARIKLERKSKSKSKLKSKSKQNK